MTEQLFPLHTLKLNIIRFTGAGQEVTERLLRGDEPPPLFLESMNAICRQAASQGCRIWIDAEQQAVQGTIDKWTINLMREHNRGSTALVYTTVQAYLKGARAKLKHQLQLATEEGWTLAVKLVRGAYISNDIRELIHDTKADTDACYNGIAADLLSGTFPGFSQENFPHLQLFLAGHNTQTIRKAAQLAMELSMAGKLKVKPEFGQLQGMADDIGCEIVQMGELARATFAAGGDLTVKSQGYAPAAYKCLTWGSVRECMQYLVRRAVENQGASNRMTEGTGAVAAELWRRRPRLLWNGRATES